MPADLSRSLVSSSDAPARAARIGIDLVRIDAIERSMADFGARFARRIFAPGELRDATVAGRLDARALAARFAAKEATIKAFDLAEAGVGWSQLEVRAEGERHRVLLSGRAADAVAAAGPYEIAVSWTHAGEHACAVVVALPHDATAPPEGARLADASQEDA